jgi:hypothetical protein
MNGLKAIFLYVRFLAGFWAGFELILFLLIFFVKKIMAYYTRKICGNLKKSRWKILKQVSPSLTDSLVCHVIHKFQNSSQLALEFYNLVGGKKRFSHSLESLLCTVIQLLVNPRRFDDAMAIMGKLTCGSGVMKDVIQVWLV